MYKWIHQFGSPKYFYDISLRLSKWITIVCIVCFIGGLYGGLVLAPADYQQGDSFRIIYVHVPAAWMSLFIYIILATSGAISLIWHIKITDIIARVSAPIGASFTFLALSTGAIWGKPMWGTYWVWDARLTSVFILFITYIIIIFIKPSFSNLEVGDKIAAIFIIIGSINLPIIKFSVDWWNTLHQPASISKLSSPSIDTSMLVPLIVMTLAFIFIGLQITLFRIRLEILERKHQI